MGSVYIIYFFCALAAFVFVVYQLAKAAAEKSLKSASEKVLKGPPQYPKKYSEDDLNGLPAPVQRYFKTVLRDGQSFARTVRVEHIGKIKTGKRPEWSWIRGTEFFSARYPAFVWNGKTTWLSAVDSFVNGKGMLTIRLLSLFRVAKYTGRHVDRSELVRWLAEAVWFPTALLGSKSLKWTAVDDRTAHLEYFWEHSKIVLKVSFSEDHKIREFLTERHDTDGKLKTWTGRVSRYQRHGGMLIPSCIEACWTDAKQPYAIFHLTKINYEF